MGLAKDLGFGLIAYRDGETDLPKLLQACAQVDERSGSGLRLADLIQAQGAIDPSVRARIEIEVERVLNASGGTNTTYPSASPAPAPIPAPAPAPAPAPPPSPPSPPFLLETVPPTIFAPPTLAPDSENTGADQETLPTDSSFFLKAPSDEFATLPPSESSSLSVPTMGASSEPPHPWGARYAVERYHDKGGLGMIWVARDLILDRVVALKEIKSDWVGHYESRRRFTREAQITGQLSHPGIVQVYDLGERGDDGRPFYVMRFVGGRTLHAVIREYHARKRLEGRDDPVAFRELLGLFVAVCRTMAYAHGQGIVHRDLKPVNMMVGNYGELVVLDWGLAKRLHRPSDTREIATWDSGTGGLSGDADENLTHGGLIGTPQYMSPEQAQGLNSTVDQLSDIYSLGATLFEILTGRNLWEGENQIGRMLARIVAEPSPTARARDATIPKPLDAICAKAMAKGREDRYDKAADLAEDVQRYLAGEPVSAYAEPWTDKFRRWTRKHRPKFAAASVALGLILVFAAYLANEASVARARRMTRGQALAQAVLAADIGYVGNLVEDLAEYRIAADPELRAAWLKSNDRQRKLRAGLAMLPVDPSTASGLAEMLLQASPEETLVIRGFLADYAPRTETSALADRYASTIDDPKIDDGARLRAAAALALFAPQDPRWPSWSSRIADPLVRENPLTMKSWSQAFLPVGDAIVEPLAGTFRNPARSETERINASNLIRDYARQPRGLAEIVSLAEGDLFELAVSRLSAQREEAIPHLQAVLRRSPMPVWSDPPLSWPALDRSASEAIERAEGWVADRFAFAQALLGRDVVPICEAMGRAGYRPTKLRPYPVPNGEVHAAVVWTRDGQPWRIAWGVALPAAEELNRRHQAEGLQPIDGSGWTEPGPSREVRRSAVWGPSPLTLRVDWSLTARELDEASHEMYPRKEDPRSVALWTGPDGESRASVVWAPQTPSQEPVALLADGRESQVQAWLNEQSKWPMDLAVGRAGLDQIFEPNRVLQDPQGVPDRGLSYAGVWLSRLAIEARTQRGLPTADALSTAKSWIAEGWRPLSVSAIVMNDGQGDGGASKTIAAHVWQRPAVPEAERLALALRQSRAAIVLARLGRPDLVWPLLKRSTDPTLRSQIIRDWARLGAGPKPIADRLRTERDPAIRQALILALGEFETPRLAPIRSEFTLDAALLADYERDPDAGTHGAIDWLLRQRLGLGADVNRLNERLRNPSPESTRDWRINGLGQTFSVIRGPVTFWMGSPLSTDYYRPEENRHLRRIERTFAIAAREVTIREYANYLAENPDVQDERQVRIMQASESQSEAPMTILDWYDAARYCNWLSKKEGLPESEWCYPPELSRDDAKTKSWALPPDMLERSGYRLPTEAEWEYACRAGSETRWHHGSNEELLSRHAWFQGNSGNRPRFVGSLHPNAFGLFDMAGNADEWTNNVYGGRYQTQDSANGAPDRVDAKPFTRDDLRVLRGGTFYETPLGLRPAERGRSQAAYRSAGFGIRVARTCR